MTKALLIAAAAALALTACGQDQSKKAETGKAGSSTPSSTAGTPPASGSASSTSPSGSPAAGSSGSASSPSGSASSPSSTGSAGSTPSATDTKKDEKK